MKISLQNFISKSHDKFVSKVKRTFFRAASGVSRLFCDKQGSMSLVNHEFVPAPSVVQKAAVIVVLLAQDSLA